MAKPKTQITKASVSAFIANAPETLRADAKKIHALLFSITKKKPKMWGKHIVGYGQYHFKSERSSQEADWPMIGFTCGKKNLTVYLMNGMGAVEKHAALLKDLGPHKASNGGCLYLKSLDGINMAVLKKIATISYKEMKKKWG